MNPTITFLYIKIIGKKQHIKRFLHVCPTYFSLGIYVYNKLKFTQAPHENKPHFQFLTIAGPIPSDRTNE